MNLETKKTSEYLRYDFSDFEVLGLAKTMARANQEYAALEETKKKVTKELAASLEEKQGEISKLSRLINNGHEYRTLPCTVTFDEPNQGEKTIRRDDNGEVVKVMKMTSEEMQIDLPLTEPKPEADISDLLKSTIEATHKRGKKRKGDSLSDDEDQPEEETPQA